jgi:hypothetical protein
VTLTFNPLRLLQDSVLDAQRRISNIRRVKDKTALVNAIYEDLTEVVSPRIFETAVKLWIRRVLDGAERQAPAQGSRLSALIGPTDETIVQIYEEADGTPQFTGLVYGATDFGSELPRSGDTVLSAKDVEPELDGGYEALEVRSRCYVPPGVVKLIVFRRGPDRAERALLDGVDLRSLAP